MRGRAACVGLPQRSGTSRPARRAPTFATVLLVGDALAWAASVARLEQALSFTSDHAAAPAAVTLADLLDWDGSVALAEGRAISARDLASVARGEQFQFWGDMIEPTAARRSGGLTEQRLARASASTTRGFRRRRFGCGRAHLVRNATGAQARTPTSRRRGRVSREMRAELEKALADGDDQ